MSDQMMKTGSVFCRKTLRAAGILLAGVLVTGLFAGSATTKTTYLITDGDLITTVEGYSGELDAALLRAGIPVGASDRVESTRQGGVARVTIDRAREITVRRDGSDTVLLAYNDTVGQVLERLHVELGPEDVVSAPLSQPVKDGMVVEVERRLALTETVTSAIPYDTVRQGTPDLYRGQERVLREGVEGQLTSREQVVLNLEGETVSRASLGQEVTRAPQAQIVEYGTMVSPSVPSSLSVSSDVLVDVSGDDGSGGVLTTLSGQALAYSRAITCRATAYTTERQSWKLTATGTTARVGAIAVDPRVIPYGTRMYIVSADGSITYGVATAEDCGGSIKGNRIDLFFDTYDECISFGVRDCTVYILES